MPKLINSELIGNPWNWVVILLMVAIFAHAWGMLDPLKTQDNSMQGSPP
jgi:hypothetical protein